MFHYKSRCPKCQKTLNDSTWSYIILKPWAFMRWAHYRTLAHHIVSSARQRPGSSRWVASNIAHKFSWQWFENIDHSFIRQLPNLSLLVVDNVLRKHADVVNYCGFDNTYTFRIFLYPSWIQIHDTVVFVFSLGAFVLLLVGNMRILLYMYRNTLLNLFAQFDMANVGIYPW